jgi:ABC-type nitrate/sulfonate/bicarbonate transport system permease component
VNPRAYRLWRTAAEIGVPIAIVAGWQLWAASAHSVKFPRPTTIAVEFRKLWLFADFDKHVVPSLERIGLGFSIAVVLGVAFGVPLGLSRWARKAAMPHIEVWRAMPPPALLPISIVLLHSIGNTQKVAFIAFFCLFPVLLNTIDGVNGVDPTLHDTTRVYGIQQRDRLWRVMLPAASPQIFAGMRISLSLALILMVISEMVASTNGIGYFVLQSQRTFAIPEMWSGIFLLGILGYVFNAGFMLIERRTLRWHRGARASALG